MSNKCPKCQHVNPDDTVYCGKCGTQFPSSEKIEVTETIEAPKKELTRGTKFADRYEIIEELGKGGMGRVYRVEDTKLKQEVALKLIKPEITIDQKIIERFRNELKTARMIAHKNVCRMFDLGEKNGIHFITMEYVRGEDLKSFIHRSGQLAVGTAIRIAKQACEGLSEAHKLGVVHRDLKSNNIMIDKKGNVRIMDFGIARSLESKGVTGAGMMIGTPEYMSPEQAEGKEVDQKSDIYSLGIILYEMLTGRLPFEGGTTLSIALKHKVEKPPEPEKYNPRISEDLSRVILKCMAKDKDVRYQNGEELLSALSKVEKGLSAASKAAPTIKAKKEKQIEKKWHNSIAVLPFTDLSPQKDQEYFCDGMAEEIINSLTKIEDFKVVARTSAFSFKEKDIDIREIGKKLNVNTVLEGSIRKAGNRLRIMAQLINIADGYHIWSERFDRELEDVFAIQDEVTLAIVEKLKVKLLRGEKARLVKRHTDNPEAYNLLLKGTYYRQMLTAEGFKKAIECLQQALQKDPNYALAYSGLAGVYCAIAYYGNVPPNEAYPKAKAYVKKALDIDNTLAEAHAALGFIYTHYDWNWAAAEQELRQALESKPNSALIHLYYSWLLTFTERHEEAIFEAKRAQELDPVSSFINTYAGLTFIWASQYDKAIEVLRMTLTLNPNFYLPHFFLGWAYLGKSMLEKAIEEFEKAVNLSGRMPWNVMPLAATYYKLGKKAQAKKLFDSLKQRSRHEYVPPMVFFYDHLISGDLDQAFEWLERACNEHDSYLGWCRIVPVDYYHIPDEPKFKALLKKAGFE